MGKEIQFVGVNIPFLSEYIIVSYKITLLMDINEFVMITRDLLALKNASTYRNLLILLELLCSVDFQSFP